MKNYTHFKGELLLKKQNINENTKDYFKRVLNKDFQEECWVDYEPENILYYTQIYKYFYLNKELYLSNLFEEIPIKQIIKVNIEKDVVKFNIRINNTENLEKIIEKNLKL